MKRLSLLIILGIFFISFISAVPPANTLIIEDRGVDIVHPETTFVKFGDNLEINFWTYNSTDGSTLTNSSLNCTTYIINDMGVNFWRFSNQAGANGLITYGKGAPLCINCWTMTMPSENLSIGLYSYKMKCQNTEVPIGGYLTGIFEVTPTGLPFSESRTQTASLGVWVLFLISVVMFIGYLFVNAKQPIKWTFLLLSIMFLMQTIYILFTFMSNEIVGNNIENYFSFLAVASSILFWFAFGLLAIMWFLTTLQTLLLRKQQKNKEKYGG